MENIIEINTWYYTLSTIAQTLAAILGVAAVFATLRLQGIVENINLYKMRAWGVLRKKEEHIESYAVPVVTKRGAKKILEEISELSSNWETKYKENGGLKSDIPSLSRAYEPNLNLTSQAFLQDIESNLDSYIEQRDKMIQFLVVPGTVTAITILVDVVLLSSPSWVQLSNSVNSGLFIFTCLLFVYSVIVIVRASWKLLGAVE